MDQDRLKMLLEAERRGLLDESMSAELAEARGRDVVPPRAPDGPSYEQLMAAARKADEMGDTEGARRLLELAMQSGGSQPGGLSEADFDAGLARISNRFNGQTPEAGVSDWALKFVPQTRTLPDGTTVEFPGDMSAADIDAAMAAYAPRTTGVEQFGSGLNEGLAGFAGAPVDLVTSGLNALGGGVNYVTGSNIPRIENPVGGSGTMRGLLDMFIADEKPADAGQRYLRRVGKEIGFGAPTALSMAAIPGLGALARNNMPAYMAASTASDTAAGAAGQTAREIAPDSPWLDMVASVVAGGGTAGLTNKLTKTKPDVPTLDTLAGRVDEGYEAVRMYDAKLTPEAWDRLNKELAEYLDDAGIDVNKSLDVDSFGPVIREVTRGADNANPSLWDAEKWRRLIQDNVVANPTLQKHGMALKERIDNFMAGLKEKDLLSGDIEALKALKDARRLAHQQAKAETLVDASNQGTTRAITSGVGGNQVNAVRQKLRPFLDKETALRPGTKKQGYTPDELAALQKVVKGTFGSNALRTLGRFSPTGSTLGALLTGGGVVGGTFGSGSALPYAVASGLGMAGLVAKPLAERAMTKHGDGLLETILNGGTKAVAKSPDPVRAGLLAELLKVGGRGETSVFAPQ